VERARAFADMGLLLSGAVLLYSAGHAFTLIRFAPSGKEHKGKRKPENMQDLVLCVFLRILRAFARNAFDAPDETRDWTQLPATAYHLPFGHRPAKDKGFPQCR
jgi:hypothetical protein